MFDNYPLLVTKSLLENGDGFFIIGRGQCQIRDGFLCSSFQDGLQIIKLVNLRQVGIVMD